MSPSKEFTARHRFAHITARKARYVADLIRGRSVNEALELLQFTPNRGARFYGKVLRSAVANASHDEAVNINHLFVSECRADDGPLLQGRLRYRPGPQGRAMPYAKRLSHLVVKVRELEGEEPRRPRSLEKPSEEAVEESDESAEEASAQAAANEGQTRKKKTSKTKGSPKAKKAPAAAKKSADKPAHKAAKKPTKGVGGEARHKGKKSGEDEK
jgi:large subunit ribosomal protein L22